MWVYIYIYIYIYMCVCVRVCVCVCVCVCLCVCIICDKQFVVNNFPKSLGLIVKWFEVYLFVTHSFI